MFLYCASIIIVSGYGAARRSLDSRVAVDTAPTYLAHAHLSHSRDFVSVGGL
jgi:hypothetical protein